MINLKRGCAVKKVGRDGKTHITTLRVSEDMQQLSWTGKWLSLKSSDNRSVSVADVVRLDQGTTPPSVTLVLADQDEERADHRESLTFIAASTSAKAALQFSNTVAALETLISEHGNAGVAPSATTSNVAARRLLKMFSDIDGAVVLQVLEATGNQAEAQRQLMELASDRQKAKASPTRKKCEVCRVRPMSVRFICGHTCCCEECSEELLSLSHPRCLYCRELILDDLHGVGTPLPIAEVSRASPPRDQMSELDAELEMCGSFTQRQKSAPSPEQEPMQPTEPRKQTSLPCARVESTSEPQLEPLIDPPRDMHVSSPAVLNSPYEPAGADASIEAAMAEELHASPTLEVRQEVGATVGLGSPGSSLADPTQMGGGASQVPGAPSGTSPEKAAPSFVASKWHSLQLRLYTQCLWRFGSWPALRDLMGGFILFVVLAFVLSVWTLFLPANSESSKPGTSDSAAKSMFLAEAFVRFVVGGLGAVAGGLIAFIFPGISYRVGSQSLQTMTPMSFCCITLLPMAVVEALLFVLCCLFIFLVGLLLGIVLPWLNLHWVVILACEVIVGRHIMLKFALWQPRTYDVSGVHLGHQLML
eukprot:CAMPEP_0113282012 /NCGR_PEP_ID=MMETSP0008_2-20120614/28618_1 /TAXON_ID=97485 /ORGANISM="Prymnesium parvum" /LENGTH=589 /DNA_ID=CAMNT_0000132489 /DNA_START=132 /DNA_END=1901 /DNA_ORIENTATION=- /assembly_acc=CAM_ASM_000153